VTDTINGTGRQVVIVEPVKGSDQNEELHCRMGRRKRTSMRSSDLPLSLAAGLPMARANTGSYLKKSGRNVLLVVYDVTSRRH